MAYSLEKWQGITESEWVTYYAHNDQERLSYLMRYIKKGHVVVEAGCGCGFQAGCIMKYKSPRLYFGFDVDDKKVLSCMNMAEINKIHINTPSKFITGSLFSINNLLFNIDKINPDIFLFTEVLEHIANYKAAFSNLSKLMPLGANLLMTVPSKGMLRDVPGHINDFGAEDLHKLCRNNNLEVKEIDVIAQTYTFIRAIKK